jgi:ankyrin repeat protein
MDINSKILQDGTLLQAMARGEHKDIVELLLNHGADPNLQGENVYCLKWTWISETLQGGYHGTPLQAAVACGHKDIFELLLNQGADPNIQGENVFCFKER